MAASVARPMFLAIKTSRHWNRLGIIWHLYGCYCLTIIIMAIVVFFIISTECVSPD